ncbi:helix-turn-helix transcriptional regulator [Candidatus Woesearchaeota archaeon]|nr:helix-turn-helix transcriptional regulator [Candidatus Woesearchaeota archaeon]
MKLTIIRLRKPAEKDVNKDLQWFSESLGLFGDRDKEKSCFRVFLELIKAARRKKPLSSDEIALRSNLTRATVIHHIHKLIESGLVTHYNNQYILRVENLESLIFELRKDLMRTLEDLEDIAKDLDEELGLIKRSRTKSSTISED